MTLAELKKSAAELTPEEQAEFAAYLGHLRRERDPEYRAELTRILEDKAPDSWARWSDLKSELED